MSNKSTSATIAMNVFSNYCGLGFHIVIAFFLSPFLVHTLGDTRYGIWSIAMSLSGYMSLMNLGIATSLNRYVSKLHKTKDIDNLLAVINSGLGLFVIVGMLIAAISPLTAWGINNFIKFDPSKV